MRHGMSPQEAGIDALKRIVRNYNGDMNRLKFLDMTYYVLRKDGAYAGVSLWEGYSPTQSTQDCDPRRNAAFREDGRFAERLVPGISPRSRRYRRRM